MMLLLYLCKNSQLITISRWTAVSEYFCTWRTREHVDGRCCCTIDYSRLGGNGDRF